MLLREQTASQVGSAQAVHDLVEAAGDQTYPVGAMHADPVTVGAWTRHGSFHSSARVLCEVTGTGVTPVPWLDAPTLDGAWAWVPALSAEVSADVARQARQSRSVMWQCAQAQARGVNWSDVFFGPDRTGQTVTGVWFVYADLLPLRAAAVDTQVLASLVRSRGTGAAPEPCPGLVRLGGLLDAAALVNLVCGANRVRRPGDLSEQERVRLRLDQSWVPPACRCSAAEVGKACPE